MWFQIKVRHQWIEGPRHILYQLSLIRKQKAAVVKAVMPTVRHGAWYCHSESILQTLVCSEDPEERKKGIERITNLRGEGDHSTQLGDSSVRPRRTPEINEKATNLLELIDWDEQCYEPLLTTSISTADLKQFLTIPMQVPAWPSHTQSIERCVKQVTEACTKVYTHERREGYIKAQEFSRKIMASNESRKELEGLLSF